MGLRKGLTAAGALAALLAVSAAPAAAKDVVIHAGRLIDGTGKAPRDKVSILSGTSGSSPSTPASPRPRAPR